MEWYGVDLLVASQYKKISVVVILASGEDNLGFSIPSVTVEGVTGRFYEKRSRQKLY